MELVFFQISLFAYLAATAAFVSHLMVVREPVRRLAIGILSVAFVLHTVALVARTFRTGVLPVTTFHDQVSVLAWLIVGLTLVLQLRYRLSVLAAIVCPLAFLTTLSAYMVHSGVRTLPPDLRSVWVPAHVAPAFLGYAIFAVACCISLIYLLQETELKAKRRRDIFRRLPSLETLDELNYRFVAWGFALFTVGIVTGSMLAKANWGEFWSWEPVQIMSLMAWLLYAMLLHMRSVGWRGRKAAKLTILGFAILLFLFVGINLVFSGRHAIGAG